MVQIQSFLGTLAAIATLATSSPIFDDQTIAPRGFSPYTDRGAPSLFPRSSCPLNTGAAASCRNNTVQSDLCCFESPNGLLVMTQFWDVNPAVGPNDSWTIHGLWPDPCNTDFVFDPKFPGCDPKRFYPSPKALLEGANRQDLIEYMSTYWTNNKRQSDGSFGTDEFWMHEWNKHGTCYSTLNPSCLPPDSPIGTEAVLYFDRVVQLFKSLPTYQYLVALVRTVSSPASGLVLHLTHNPVGIMPANVSTTFELSKMQDAIRSSPFGKTVGFNCAGNNLEIYYWFNLKGSVIDGELIPIDAPNREHYPEKGIRYLPKGTVTASRLLLRLFNSNFADHSRIRGPPPGLPAKAKILPLVNGNLNGGLITAGVWSALTPATYTVEAFGDGFTLKTNKGLCGVSGTSFSCGTAVSSSVFSAVPDEGGRLLLALDGETNWSAGAVPSGSKQEAINLGVSGAVDFNLTIVNATAVASP